MFKENKDERKNEGLNASSWRGKENTRSRESLLKRFEHRNSWLQTIGMSWLKCANWIQTSLIYSRFHSGQFIYQSMITHKKNQLLLPSIKHFRICISLSEFSNRTWSLKPNRALFKVMYDLSQDMNKCLIKTIDLVEKHSSLLSKWV